MKIKFDMKDKGKILSTLYNKSKVQGLGFLHAENKDMTVAEGDGDY